jgi:hypothetical protein
MTPPTRQQWLDRADYHFQQYCICQRHAMKAQDEGIKIEPWNWQMIEDQKLVDEIGEREYHVMQADQAREERAAREEEKGVEDE